MNSLSWMIYAADVTQSASAVSGLACAGLTISCAIYAAARAISDDTNAMFGRKDEVKPILPVVRPWLIAALGLAAFSAFLPSRTTIYMIAASEIGERVVTSDGVKSIVDPATELLRKKITTELEKLTKESGK